MKLSLFHYTSKLEDLGYAHFDREVLDTVETDAFDTIEDLRTYGSVHHEQGMTRTMTGGAE